MKQNGSIDIAGQKVIFENYSKPQLRNLDINWPKTASRGIVRMPDGKVLVSFKAKTNQYKLPGRGRERDETPEETFIREVLEETGYVVKNIQYLGITKGFTQVSYIFVADANRNTQELNLDEDELKNETQVLAIGAETLLAKMKESLEEYADKNDEDSIIKYAITLRDYNVVKYCLEQSLI